MFVTKKSIPRRTFLRGAGATLALPLLDAMIPAFPTVAQAASKTVPRLGYFILPNGMHMPAWTPKTVGPDFELSPTLAGLAPYREYLTVLSGLSNYQSTLAPGGGVHSRAHAAWLTGALAKSTEGADVQLSTSVDQYAARVLGKETVLESLELSTGRGSGVGNCEYNYSCLYRSTVSWRDPTTPNPTEHNPRVIFERLFGETEASPGLGPACSSAQKRSSTTSERSWSVCRESLGAGDRGTLEQYVDTVRKRGASH